MVLVTVYSENYMKQISAMCGQNAEFFNVESSVECKHCVIKY
jgi:hypothetical protein